MHKNSEKEDEIDDKKVAVPPVAKALHVTVVRKAILQHAKAQHRRKALSLAKLQLREKSGSRAPLAFSLPAGSAGDRDRAANGPLQPPVRTGCSGSGPEGLVDGLQPPNPSVKQI